MTSTIVLVTGANSGIGFATSKVLACASEGYHVVMASRSLEKAKSAMSEIEAAGIIGTLSIVQLEVTDDKSIKEAAAQVQQQFGRLDVLVNNAAASGIGEHDLKTRFQLCLETNVMGPALVSAAFRPLLLKSQKPYSIYVSSGERTLVRNAFEKPVIHQGIQHGDAYPVSKAALNYLAVLEHGNYGSKGLKVFAISPGFVRSNLRGPTEEARSGWGKAGDPEVSGEVILRVVRGERDTEVGCLIHKDGIYPW